MLALIDGDVIVYQAATATTKSIDWGDNDGVQTVTDLDEAKEAAYRLIDDWTRLAGARRPAVMFSGRTGANFRKILDPTYKAGRKEKPEGYWEIVDAIEARFKCHRVEGLEADDLMGIAGTDPERWGNTVIVSIDKDMKCVPARVFNPAKDRLPLSVSELNANLFWMTQTLTGDPCDGYKGCPKIGPVNAARILADAGYQLGAMWAAVVKTFQSAGLTYAHAITQARLARILRCCDYNRKTKEIQLWHPDRTVPHWMALADVPQHVPT